MRGGKLSIVILIILIAVILLHSFYFTYEYNYSLIPQDVSKVSSKNVQVSYNSIDFYGNGTYGDGRLVAVIENLSTTNKLIIHYSIDANGFNFGEYNTKFVIGSFVFGFIVSKDYGGIFYYGSTTHIFFKPMYLALTNSYSATITITHKEISYVLKLPKQVFGNNLTITMSYDISNVSALMYAGVPNYFLMVSMANTDMQKLSVKNLLISTERVVKQREYLITILSISIIVLVWAVFYFDMYELSSTFFIISSILGLFFVSTTFADNKLNEVLGLLIMSILLSIIFYLKEKFYTDFSQDKQLENTYLIGLIFLFIFLGILLFYGVSAMSSEVVNYNLIPTQNLYYNPNLYHIAISTITYVLLFSGLVLLSIENEITKSLGAIFITPAIFLVAYIFFQNTIFSIATSIFALFSAILLDFEYYNFKEFTKYYLSIVLIMEMVIFSFITFFL